MKKFLALLFAAAIALSAAGCAAQTAQIGEATVPLSGNPAAGNVQVIAPVALGAKIAAGTEVPKIKEKLSGVTVLSNTNGAIDVSNIEEGYILAKYTGSKKVTIKIQIYLTEDNKYNYTLNGDGKYEAFPLSEGDGKYTIKILENTKGNSYAVAYSCTVDVKLRNPLLPFMYSTKYINYADATESVKKAAELVKDCKTDVEKVEAVYKFVTGNVVYDKDFAAKVVSGSVTNHVPVLDNTLKTKKGICFDYAALMAGMLRSQGVPVKMVHGYAGQTYHAWINVFIQGVGWIDKVIYFDGENWTMMDPTFVAGSKNLDAISKFVGDGNKYTDKQVF